MDTSIHEWEKKDEFTGFSLDLTNHHNLANQEWGKRAKRKNEIQNETLIPILFFDP